MAVHDQEAIVPVGSFVCKEPSVPLGGDWDPVLDHGRQVLPGCSVSAALDDGGPERLAGDVFPGKSPDEVDRLRPVRSEVDRYPGRLADFILVDVPVLIRPRPEKGFRRPY